ncbi:MAG: NAD-dependent epimerase/dehydratase family protein [Alphaproteobacteria bacterium]
MTGTPVLVTGANGYVGSWVVERLLARGHNVHGTVRDPGDGRKVGHLLRLAGDAPGRLTLFAADLLDEAGFDAPAAGCEVVFHTASPFAVRGVRDPVRELIEPARRGTRAVLEAATRAGSVRRVVLTSSVAAIYGDAADLATLDEDRYDERHWNRTSSERHRPYSYSKTVAERLAWEIAAAQDRWDLVVLNPGLVLGPALSPHATSESVALMRDFASGLYRFGAPALEVGIVDVRDVADAHMLAAETAGASGRHILVSETRSLLEIGQILRARFGAAYPFPRFVLPKPLVVLTSALVGIPMRFAARNVGYPLRFDSAYARADLGVVFRPAAAAIVEHFQQLLDDGLIRRS